MNEIKCPKCGHVFKETKGVLMNWDFSKPIPADLQDETPFHCPEWSLSLRTYLGCAQN